MLMQGEASAGGRDVVVDLSLATSIDSTGLKAILDAWRSQHVAGKTLLLRRPSPKVLRTVRAAGLEGQLAVQAPDSDAPGGVWSAPGRVC